MFDQDGHVQVGRQEAWDRMQRDPGHFVDELLLVGTPKAFATYGDYTRFLSDIARALHVHPKAIIVRGSGLLGYSLAPKKDKLWNPMRHGDDPSDIDIAVVDVDRFENMDDEVQRWERRQRRPSPNERGLRSWLQRENYRRYSCVSDKCLPPNTCMPYRTAISAFSTASYCEGVERKVSVFFFRDWWCVRERSIFDLREVLQGVNKGSLDPPPAPRALAEAERPSF